MPAKTIAVTGATGFLGRYLVSRLHRDGASLRCWRRPTSDLDGFGSAADDIEWIPGALPDAEASRQLVEGCQAVVHAGLQRSGTSFRDGEGDLVDYVETNLLGTIRLMEAALAAGVERFIFISTCAVHERILDDRPLDEAHPLWPLTHYGAHKAAIEKFIHSYGFGHGFNVCSLRPTGIYGLARPATASKWYGLVAAVVKGESVHCQRGGKEVHAADVAGAVATLLEVDDIAGEAFSCYDQYISEFEVATLARELAGSSAEILGEQRQPQHQIINDKLRSQGTTFGGQARLQETVGELIEAVRRTKTSGD